jgi:hypothetical protein
MKTTIELSDSLFRKVKSTAAERGQTLKHFITEAVTEKLGGNAAKSGISRPAWMEGFGKLRRLRKETRRIEAVIAEEFELIEPEDRA